MKIPSLKKLTGTPVDTAKAVAKKVPAPKKVAAKKVATKVATAPKKAVAKKVTKATVVKPKYRLVVASDSESFWVTDGQVLNSLIALEAALATMPKSVYSYHISATGSDFADWVELVLLAPECARALRNAKTAAAAKTVVTKYLKAHHGE